MRFTINENGCWIFNGPLNKDGYGKVSFKNKTYSAHRFMAHLTIKPIEYSFQFVAHHCDTPACINPQHLFITTAAGNSQDRDLKKRGACGEKSHLSKLTSSQVKAMRSLYENGMKISDIARKYPVVKYGTVLSVIRNKIWKSV